MLHMVEDMYVVCSISYRMVYFLNIPFSETLSIYMDAVDAASDIYTNENSLSIGTVSLL
jgi:hypothetical protein